MIVRDGWRACDLCGLASVLELHVPSLETPPLCGAGSSDWVLSSPTLKNKKEGILSIVGTLQHSWHLIVFLMWSNSTDANTGQRKNITLGITVQIHQMHSYLQTLSHGRKDSVNNSQHNGMKWEEPSGSGNGKGAQSLITGRKLTSLNCAQMLCGKQVLKAIRERARRMACLN